jgi:hypothetical protein
MATKSFVSRHVKTIVLGKLAAVKQLQQQITSRIVAQAVTKPPWNSDASVIKSRQPARPPGLRKTFNAWSEGGDGTWFWKHGTRLERNTVVWNNGIWLMGHAYGPKDRYKVLWLEQGEWQATKWLTSEKSIMAAVAAARLTGGA